MRILFVFLLMASVNFTVYAQKKKIHPKPVPVPLKMMDSAADTLRLDEYAFPILFAWEMNADTVLVPHTAFKTLIRLKFGVTEVNSYYSLDTLTLKKTKKKATAAVAPVTKPLTGIDYFETDLTAGIITLSERGRIVMKLKIFYDKKNQVSHLQDLENKRIYWHIPSDEPIVDLAPSGN